MDSNPTDWRYVIEGVLFAHCVTTYASTRYFPIPLHNRKAVLPIDIRHNKKYLSNLNEPFDKNMFDTVLESATSLRNQIHHKIEDNIKKTQEKQQHEYELQHLKSNDIKVWDKVPLRNNGNNKRNDRKSGKFILKWLEPYEVDHLADNGLASLKNQKGNVFLKKVQQASS